MGHPVLWPARQPQPGAGCWWQQPGEVTAGTNLHGAPCLLLAQEAQSGCRQ